MQLTEANLPPITTFTDYFRMNVYVDELLAAFGYSYRAAQVRLPITGAPPAWGDELRRRIEAYLPYVAFANEQARRECLVAPVLLGLVSHFHAHLRIEYPIEVSERLRGTLDYLIQGERQFLVVEAKNADLQRGFTQLAMELVALDQWNQLSAPTLYGAVTMGNAWQFGILDRTDRRVTQVLRLFSVPDDLTDLLRVLVAILEGRTVLESAEASPAPCAGRG